uniref:EF-hand domain-containing protein n=1 Tax=Zooxanthella nutricula TaxID=1333877 RepID=A0A7S2IN36_9DINO
MLGGMRTLMWSVCLIILPVYALCLVFRETLGSQVGHGAGYFNSVPRSFFTVFRCIIIGDFADDQGRPVFLMITESFGWAWGVFYGMLSVFMTFGLFNVIMAMFVDNVVETGKARERQARKWRLRNDAYFASKISELLSIVMQYSEPHEQCRPGSDPPSLKKLRSLKNSTDVDVFELIPDGMQITPEVFAKLRSDPQVCAIFDDLDIADDDQYSLFDTLDVDGSGTVDMHELCDGMLKLRGDACRSDIIAINYMLQALQVHVHGFNQSFLHKLQSQEDRIHQMHAVLCEGTASAAMAECARRDRSAAWSIGHA